MKRYLKVLNDPNDPEHGMAILLLIYGVGGVAGLLLLALMGARL